VPTPAKLLEYAAAADVRLELVLDAAVAVAGRGEGVGELKGHAVVN